MDNSIYPEPDGYVRMRLRDYIVGAIVVTCFVLAASWVHVWRTVVRRRVPKLSAAVIGYTKQHR